jgi:hypothetical protein
MCGFVALFGRASSEQGLVGVWAVGQGGGWVWGVGSSGLLALRDQFTPDVIVPAVARQVTSSGP